MNLVSHGSAATYCTTQTHLLHRINGMLQSLAVQNFNFCDWTDSTHLYTNSQYTCYDTEVTDYN